MAIHGQIASMNVQGNNLVIDLVEPAGSNDPVGQSQLIVKDFTIIPDIGDVVWGGADSVRIETSPNTQIVYKRLGISTLIEVMK